MKRFKNPKAQELFDEAEELEKYALEEIEKHGGLILDSYADMLTEAAGLRVQADDLEEEYEDEMER